MTLHRFEVGIVSTDRGIVDFLLEVFELEEPSLFESTAGTLYRFGPPCAGLKVMIPKEPPKQSEAFDNPLTATGLRYLTMDVDDLDPVIGRATERGAKVTLLPMEFGPGAWIAIFQDPSGNVFEVLQRGS